LASRRWPIRPPIATASPSKAVADLQHEPQTTVSISQHTGRGTLAGAFTGVALWTLLNEAA